MSLARAQRAALLALALVALAFSVLGIVSLAVGRPWGLFIGTMDDQCDAAGFGCTVVTGFLFPLAAFAVAFWIFLVLRYRRVRRAYVGYALENAAKLVETAGGIVHDVVGRDDLCDILQEDLRDDAGRQPHVLVGGLGIGKTAVLVKLTERLAERGAVPVPIRLRDSGERLDFLALARDRFVTVVSHQLRSSAEVERVWQELRRDDRIVILADGLDEAFADSDTHDRDHRVRVAVREAAEQRFPLIIASRPHKALRALQAARVHLEPLSEESALDHIKGSEAEADESRLHCIVEVGHVTETPVYLRIAHDLNAEGLLEHHHVDTRGADRVPLRLRLMEAWLDALVAGKLDATADIPLAEHQRKACIAHLEALACVGLRHDTQQLDLAKHWNVPDSPDRKADKEIVDRLQGHVEAQLAGLTTSDGQAASEVFDMQAAASRGMQLGLVDNAMAAVRFPHSILQAYLASRVLGVAIAKQLPDPQYLELALEDPGRELLLALVMYARSPGGAGHAERVDILDALRAARKTTKVKEGAKLLPVLATELEIALAIELSRRDGEEGPTSSNVCADLRETADALIVAWRDVRADDDETRFAKLNAVARLADAAKLLSDGGSRRRRSRGRAERRVAATAAPPPARPESAPPPPPPQPPPPAPSTAAGLWSHLYTVCRSESLYETRVAAAEALGDGGDAAWGELEPFLTPRETPRAGSPGRWDEKRWQAILSCPELPVGRHGWEKRETERRYSVHGWLLPMIVRSLGDDDGNDTPDQRRNRENARLRLKEWVDRVGEKGGMPLCLEAALADGFKRAANRRPRHSHEWASSRGYLQQQATVMIHRARFWYTRLTLLHALALWELARLEFPGHPGHDSAPAQHDPVALVDRWLRMRTARRAGRNGDGDAATDHPFVLEVADLVVAALRTREPTRFIWIDESDVVAKIGSRAIDRAPFAERNLWIPDSAGWVALDPAAQQLVGDIQIALNLAERSAAVPLAEDTRAAQRESAAGREQRLTQLNALRLPLCLTGDRCPHLKPSHTVGMADLAEPGDDCARHCPVDLCPYPPRGEQPYRAELSEAFCRHQAALVKRFGGRAAWQEATVAELRQFWGEMEERARL